MPGNQQLHLRLPQETLERYREGAAHVRMSLTTFVLKVMDHAVDKVLDQKTGPVGTTVQKQPAPVQPELPAKPIPYGPDMPIGMMNSDQIRRFLAGVLADEAEQAERRLEREYYSSY